MTSELMLQRKWSLRAHGRRVIFVKQRHERPEHVLMKAFLWALYLPRYPDLKVEIPIHDRYKPDLVQLDAEGMPVFWGEAGEVASRKILSLARRFRHTHFAIAKWATDLTPLVDIVASAVRDRGRTAPFDLLNFPADSAERFLSDEGEIWVTAEQIDRIQILDSSV